MANYSVFGTGIPPYALSSLSDGEPSIVVGNYFYTTGSGTEGWRCRGGRVYIPNDVNYVNQSLTISAWVATTTAVNLSSAPLRTGTVTSGPTGGWAEVVWSTPFTIDAGQYVFIGYTFNATRDQYYMAAAEAVVGDSSSRSVDDVDLYLAEKTITALSSSRGGFRIDAGATTASTAWYGTDILVDDGAVIPPVAAYGFNEASGTTTQDSSGNGHHLTVNSSSNFDIGQTANGLHQVGGGGANKITNAAAWMNTSQRTIMFWARRGSEGANALSRTVYQTNSNGDPVFAITLSDGTSTAFTVRHGNAETTLTTPERVLGSWFHYALTYDQARVRAYVDGSQVGEAVVSGTIDVSDGNLYFYGGDYQQQVIDDLRIFDQALNPSQILGYMANVIAPTDAEAPSAPANLAANVSGQNVLLAWDAAADNVGIQDYIVYRGDASGFVADVDSQVGIPTTNTYTDTNAPGGTWYYKVKARDEAGNTSGASNEVSAEVIPVPPPTEFLYPSGLGWSEGTQFDDSDAAGQTFGIQFGLSNAAIITGVRFYSPGAQSGANFRLWENGVAVAATTNVALVSGWNVCTFDAPYIASQGLSYVASVFLSGPAQAYTTRANSFLATRTQVGPAYSQSATAGRLASGDIFPSSGGASWYGVDVIVDNQEVSANEVFGTTIAEENALPGASPSEWTISGAGDMANLGFARQFSVNAGETVQFSCHGPGVVIDIYRIGHYGGLGWRKIRRINNLSTMQPDPTTISNSNGATTCISWSTTASWDVPPDAMSGLFVGVYRNPAEDNASYIPFVVRNDARSTDVVVKTSDTTWALAYNYYGTPSSPLTGKSFYGSGGPLGATNTRAHAATYMRPIVTREDIPQTYWLACEAPFIRFAEANGIDVKYVASRDLHASSTPINNASVLISSGHDEYWSQGMRDTAITYRDNGGHILFMSGNEVFWRTRFSPNTDTMWCYKDTLDGPGAHVGGVQLDPVAWTGTWKDTRYAQRQPENMLTGTDFRMNGINDHAAVLLQAASYASHPVWRNSALLSGNVTIQGVIGFEADRMLPTQPAPSQAILASHTVNVDGSYVDDNGQSYSGNGDLTWGIVSQRYASGAVVIGFGTCQWSWGLDGVHDRGTNAVQPAAQQFMVNLLTDLGAPAATLIAGLTQPTPVALDNYGLVPSAPIRSGKVKYWDGNAWTAHPLKVWDGNAWVTRKMSGESGTGLVEGKG